MDDGTSSLKTTLRQIRDYSDLTLDCDGLEFKVHRAYLCAQSPVISAALKGDFMEAKTGMIHMDFDIQTVRRFIEFIYTGDYHVSPNPAVDVLSSGALDKSRTIEGQLEGMEIGGVDAAGLDTGVGSLGSSEEIANGLVCHGHMNSLADYYDISALAALSRSKVEKTLTAEWSAKPFCDLAQQSISSTNDKSFLRMLGAVAADHIHELLGKGIFDEGGLAEGLAPYILPGVVSKLKAAEAREAQLKSGLSLAEAAVEGERQESARLSQNVEQCIELLEEHKSAGAITQPTSYVADVAVPAMSEPRGTTSVTYLGVVW
ncbi:hypothetical protein O1611_g2000 [Lasiodiplodia mahajangana]|uniref:Uncharacterized protein n=1 Tax=Lasiodiplodia mahajangana TaxID=1108764 RepID=A0ACC2JWN8_9PEZI|nr:hypothetical protein O1611_g2000 [Lasiodiplodia mahajangana]